LTHAEDFAKAFNGLLGLPAAIGEDFHITSDEILSWNQIYQTAAAAVGCEANIVHVPSHQICKLDPEYIGSLLGDKSECALFDNSKIKRFVPHYQATIPFSEGIKQAINWFEEDPKRQFIDPQTNVFIERLLQYTL
jgi:nucleoside-diphosphate-sugar epimerase